MYVNIIMTGSGTATGGLLDTEDLKRFSVRVAKDCPDELVASWLAESGAGHYEGDHVAVSVQWLRQRTEARPRGWQTGFEKMLDYASTKGWMDDARTLVMAHVEKV
jgi:hypothetical protein